MARLGDILKKNLRSSGISETVDAARFVSALQELLREMLPKEVAERMKPVSFKYNALTVKVESASVGQELKMHERELLQKLSEKFPETRIERIRFEL